VAQQQYEFKRLEMPLQRELIDELLAFWKQAYDEPNTWIADVLTGNQEHLNRNIMYLAQDSAEVVAACRLTISRSDQRLGLLGEVATATEHRGRHLAHRLCRSAAEDFDRENGQALFLGTGNPIAAKVYSRLGWRFLAGTAVMLRVKEQLPEEFLVDYFRGGLDLAVTISPAGAGLWANMVSLLVTPHDWVALDANAAMLSTRYYRQQSCEGLYPRYNAVETSGTWFSLTRADGAVVGLASAMIPADRRCCVDAFTHAHYQNEWLGPLYQAAIDWAQSRGAESVHTTCAPLDHLKQAAIESLGFRPTNEESQLELFGNVLPLRIFEKQ